MNEKIKILAISGSTRSKSSNLGIIKAIINFSSEDFSITLYDELTTLPHFNPDLDTDNPPENIFRFREQIKEADGVLICTPEYAMGVPGTLKNAIDWTVSSCEFSHKPVALITASSLGEKAHQSLLETLKIIECDIPDESQLLISYVKTKVSPSGEITDENTLIQLKKLMESLVKTIRRG